MGYSHKLKVISKERYNSIKDLSKEEFEKQYGFVESDGSIYIEFGENLGIKPLYDLGKYLEFSYEPFTKNALTFSDGDTEFLLANEAMFLALIEFYKVKVFEYYKELLNEVDKENKDDVDLYRIKFFFRSMTLEWGDFSPYQIKPDSDVLVTSWKYEYAIFELVRLYKAFDWEKDNLLLTGS